MVHSISNIIWKKGWDHFEDFLSAVKDNSLSSIELSVNSIFEEPLHMGKSDLYSIKKLLNKYSISVSGIHSLTYTRPDLEIFGGKNNDELASYIKHYIKIAEYLGTKNLVFGSAQSRKTYNYSKEQANEIFSIFLDKLNKPLLQSGILLHIEPLPSSYCNYLNSFLEGVNILRHGSFTNIAIQLDIRSILETSEDLDEIFSFPQFIKHVHTSNPQFRIPGSRYSAEHRKINNYLRRIEYKGYISGEILNHSNENQVNYIKTAIESIKEFYV
jgi:hypothetical protein